MATVLASEVNERYDELFARASAGEEVIVADHKHQQLKLVPVAAIPTGKRQPGTWKGRVSVPDSFWEPLPPGYDGWPEDDRD